MNDPKRTTEAPKTGQQIQSPAPQTDKGVTQQGGSDQKSGQQSQGTSSQNPAVEGQKSGSSK